MRGVFVSVFVGVFARLAGDCGHAPRAGGPVAATPPASDLWARSLRYGDGNLHLQSMSVPGGEWVIAAPFLPTPAA